LAEAMGMSERRAQTALLQAFRDGFATRERARRGRPYVYSLA